MRPTCLLPPGFETTDIGERYQNLDIRILKKDPERFANEIDLLEGCVGGSECRLHICRLCLRKTRLHLVREGCRHFEPLARRRELIAFSIVLPDETGHSDRGPPEFRRLRSRLKRRLERLPLPVPLLLAGIDVSLNEKAGRSHWQLQLYGLTHAVNAETLREAFGDDKVKGLIRIRLCTDLGRALTYALKTQFLRRISYVDRTGRWNTRKVGLSNSKRRLVAWWLRDVRCWDTVFLVGLTRRGDRLVLLRRRSKLSFSRSAKVAGSARARRR
jgi:hypothetical protein